MPAPSQPLELRDEAQPLPGLTKTDLKLVSWAVPRNHEDIGSIVIVETPDSSKTTRICKARYTVPAVSGDILHIHCVLDQVIEELPPRSQRRGVQDSWIPMDGVSGA